MVKALKQEITEILEHNRKYNIVFSVFKKWLTEEECENEIMSVYDVKSIDDYMLLQTYELNYLKLLIELNEEFGLQFINLNTLRTIDDLDFAFLIETVSSHIITEKEKLFYAPTKKIFIMLSSDFNIYVYTRDISLDTLKRIMSKNHFYTLLL